MTRIIAPKENNISGSNQTIDSKINKRLKFIDVAKGLGIILVVFAHINYTPSLLTTIYSFHMPLFFVISGMMFNRNKYPTAFSFIKKRLKTLICPYIFFYSLALIYITFFKNLVNGFSSFDWCTFASDFAQMFLAQGSAKVVIAPLWFIPCLFAVEIMYYFISKFNKKLIVLICSVLVFVGWLLESAIPFDNTILPWSLDSAFFALGFFALGNLNFDNIKHIISNIEKRKHRVLLLFGIAILCLTLIIPLALFNGHVSLGSKILGNGFVFYLTGIIGTIGVLGISVLLKNSKFLLFCGQNSFCIMAVHCLLRNTLYAFLSIVGIEMYDKTKFLQTIIPFVAILVLTLLLTIIYNKLKSALIKSNKHIS